eukprot:SM000062S19902  [mRNA]  locus=s62:205349:209388:- [translate_table: standard]
MAALTYYIALVTKEVQPFEPYSILGLEVGASDSDIKKSYYKLSRQYHPDKNPDPAAEKYFVDFISKAYQALTDKVAKENWEKYGHPDGRQSVSIGIALPKFMLDFQGRQGAYLLLGLVGLGILTPLLVVVIFLSRSAKYTGNNIMQQTVINYYHLIRPSLAPSKVLDVLLKSAEFLEMPVRRGDEEPLVRLFTVVRSELNLDPKNLKQETIKFWKRHSALVKAELLMLAQLTREGANVPKVLQADFQQMLKLCPRLLEELMKMSVLPRMSPFGWLRPALGVLELSQSIVQAVPLSARKTSEKAGAGGSEGIAPFLQLPHVDETVVKKLGRKKVRTFQELKDLPVEERQEVLTSAGGLTLADARDVEATLDMMPILTLDAFVGTEGEEDGIQEGDIATLKVWIHLKRPCGLVECYPHCPYFPYPKEELFWLLLADTSQNSVWVSQRVTFMDEGAAISAAAKAIGEMEEGAGKSDAEVLSAVKAATERVRGGSRLVMTKFQAPEEGLYTLTVFCLSDFWLGCDKKVSIKLKVGKRSRAGTRAAVAATSEEDRLLEDGEEDEAEAGLEEGEGEEDDDDDESEYSEDEEEDEVEPERESGGAKSGAMKPAAAEWAEDRAKRRDGPASASSAVANGEVEEDGTDDGS